MRVPLVVLTGFLGAGKTTLLNQLLAARAARQAPGQLGVIVNELGAIGVDGALLAPAAGAGGGTVQQIELPGGCVCCVLGDDLGDTLVQLCDANPALDAIVLETTGVAEPIGIAWAVQRPGVEARVRLAAVVTLVDATAFRASRALTAAVDAQVAYADVVLVTKAALAPDEVAPVASAIATLAPRALLRNGETAEHAMWVEQLLSDPDVERANPDAPHGSPGHVHDDHCRESGQPHAHGIDSVWVPAQGELDLEELEDQLAALPPNYVRIKGILRALDPRADAATPGWFAVHRVGPRVSSEGLETPKDWQPRIVALGPRVAAEPLAACIAAATRSGS